MGSGFIQMVVKFRKCGYENKTVLVAALNVFRLMEQEPRMMLGAVTFWLCENPATLDGGGCQLGKLK
jgi:hypothetical protein